MPERIDCKSDSWIGALVGAAGVAFGMGALAGVAGAGVAAEAADVMAAGAGVAGVAAAAAAAAAARAEDLWRVDDPPEGEDPLNMLPEKDI